MYRERGWEWGRALVLSRADIPIKEGFEGSSWTRFFAADYLSVCLSVNL